MLPFQLHVLGRRCPKLIPPGDLFRSGQNYLFGARSCQDSKFEGARRGPFHLSELLHECRQFSIRQSRVVLDLSHLRQFRQQLIKVVPPSGGIFSVPVAVHFGPAQDLLDATPHPPRRLGFRGPDWFEDSMDQTYRNIAHRELAQDWLRIGRNSRSPLCRVLGVSSRSRARRTGITAISRMRCNVSDLGIILGCCANAARAQCLPSSIA